MSERGLEVHPPGTTFLDGKLEVVGLLGAGGMGAVYLVTHRLTRHRRALKILHPEYAKNADVVARFLREASVAGTLGTPHVVETFDAGQLPDGSPYVLMEVLEGESLADALERGLPSDHVARIVAGVCEGLTVAHAAGIIHRDLKPDNIFLTRDAAGNERVKLLDFGISKFASTQDFAGNLTRDGAMMGTPYYMSPEQTSGAKNVDERSDVYSLGVVLYEALAGRPPFVAESFPALIVMIHDGSFEPLDRAAPNVDPRLVSVVHRAMARDREVRFPNAEALRRALLPFTGVDEHAFSETLPSLPAPATPSVPSATTPVTRGAVESEAPSAPVAARPATSRRVVWALVSIVVVGLAALLAWQTGEPDEASITPIPSAQTSEGSQREAGLPSAVETLRDESSTESTQPVAASETEIETATATATA
ncbi:MAG: protein kinase, partial [Myxococcota bacterium]|nr:protein kinase [Myxococcota bacterium]